MDPHFSLIMYCMTDLRRAASSGMPRQISLSKRPALRRAGSRESGLLVAPITRTCAVTVKLFKSVRRQAPEKCDFTRGSLLTLGLFLPFFSYYLAVTSPFAFGIPTSSSISLISDLGEVTVRLWCYLNLILYVGECRSAWVVCQDATWAWHTLMVPIW